MSDKSLMCLTYQDLVILEMQIKLFYFSPISFLKRRKLFFLSASKHAMNLFLFIAGGGVTWYVLSGKHLAIQYILRLNETMCTVSRTCLRHSRCLINVSNTYRYCYSYCIVLISIIIPFNQPST